MVVVIEKSRIIRKHHCLVRCFAQISPRLIELGLLDMAAVNLIELPVMAVCVDYSRVFDLGIDVVHVLQTPESSANSLRKRERLTHKLRVYRLALDWEEQRYERKAYTTLVSGILRALEVLSQVILLQVAKSLVHQRVYCAIELTQGAGACLELERNIKGSVTCGLY